MPGTSWRESNDFDGKADLVKGVIGEVRLADVLVAPSAGAENEAFRWAEGSPAAGRWAADKAMKVSTHLAVASKLCQRQAICQGIISKLTDDGLLILAAVVELEQLASTQRKDHTLIIFLKVVVYLRGNQGSQLSFREGFIFIQSLTRCLSATSTKTSLSRRVTPASDHDHARSPKAHNACALTSQVPR